MTIKKSEKKPAVKKPPAKKPPAKKASVPKPPPVKPAAPVKPAVPAKPPPQPRGPAARTCPLVLDGELDAADFTPNACLSCDEFDCRFCETAAGSGALRSRLFAGGGDGEDAEDLWGEEPDDADFDLGGGGEEEEGDEDDPF